MSKKQLLIYVTSDGRRLLERLTAKLRARDGGVVPHNLSSTVELALHALDRELRAEPAPVPPDVPKASALQRFRERTGKRQT